jgi:hypothetical protein
LEQGTGALDGEVTPDDQLSPGVDYRRPRNGGDGMWDIVGDLSGRRVLDLGCGLGPYRGEIESRGGKWIGLELTGPACSIIGDGMHLPFADGSFDDVLCAAVLEHVKEPNVVVAEINRVLVDGGKAFGYVPFHEPFHGLSYFHMSHLGLEHLLRKNGLTPTHVFPPHIGVPYLVECMLFQRKVPVLQPLVRSGLQLGYQIILGLNRMTRNLVQAINRMRGKAVAKSTEQYALLLALRFGIGFNFVAVKEGREADASRGYSDIVGDNRQR